jgi:hypothetical protein
LGIRHQGDKQTMNRLLCSVVPAVCALGVCRAPTPAEEALANPPLVKLPFSFPTGMENTPVVFRGRPVMVANWRSTRADDQDQAYLFIQDLVTGEELAHFGKGFSFVSGIVNGDELNVFATENTNTEWTKDVFRFWSTDLQTWQQAKVVTRQGHEHLFNTSVCRDDRGFVMAYESNKPVQWSFRFARSQDLATWEPVEGIQFSDTAQQTACANPTIRYFSPYYYVIYGGWRWKGPGARYEYLLPETRYTTFVARSRDLAHWEISPTRGPMLDPVEGEGINNTDADLFEWEGRTYIYYATGDQATWGTIRVAMYDGPMERMLAAYFPPGVETVTFDATAGAYTYP